MNIQNMDALAARAAERMCQAIGKPCAKDGTVPPEKADTVFTKALGMVQESGTYAGTIYLLYQSGDQSNLDGMTAEQRLSCCAMASLVNLLGEEGLGDLGLKYKQKIEPNQVNQSKAEVRKHMQSLAGKGLEQMFLAKQLWELALTYARYIARGSKKAKGGAK